VLVEAQVEHIGEAVRLAVTGEIDLATADQLRSAGLRVLKDPACKALILNLSGVEFMDSTGLSVLVDLRNATRPEQAPIQLEDPSARVSELLSLTAMDTVFEITRRPAS
jgi:anti-sigma B factor antagonist